MGNPLEHSPTHTLARSLSRACAAAQLMAVQPRSEAFFINIRDRIFAKRRFPATTLSKIVTSPGGLAASERIAENNAPLIVKSQQ